MGQVKIIVDSTADIPKHLVDSLNISVIPIKVHIGGEDYLDSVDIHPHEFYSKMKSSSEIPTTSQPSPIDIMEAYRGAMREGYKEIISMHISSKMSGTYQSALLAKTMIEEDYDDVRITVIDTKTVTIPFGIIAILAARAALAGKSHDEIVALIEKVRQTEVIVALVDTLEYLQKGGRIGKAAALVGSLLNIKPIISISDDGEVIAIDKVRGKNKAVNRCFEILKEKVPSGPVIAVVLHADCPDQVDVWVEKVRNTFDVQEEFIVEIGPAVGTHTGPGTIGCLLVPLNQI